MTATLTDFLSPRDAAAYAGWSVRTLYRNLREGLPSVKPPHGRRQFSRSDIDDFKARHRVVVIEPVHASQYSDTQLEAARRRAVNGLEHERLGLKRGQV